MKKNKILFAISSLGLGHATRTLPIIRMYLSKGYKIDIISYGNAINFLKKSLTNFDIKFIELKDYPPLERGRGISFYYYLIIDLFITKNLIRKEHNFVLKIQNNYDFIISDGRYGVYSHKIPSFLISHQLSFIIPKFLNIFQNIADKQNIKYFNNFTKILIPDYLDKNNNLAGKLSHPKWINDIKHEYIGILSDLYDKKVENKLKIYYLFTITGYLEADKNDFVNKLSDQSKKLNGLKIFTIGDYKNKYKKTLEKNIIFYSSFTNQEKIDFLKQAELIISRAGYTTIMDLVELDKKAILFSTPNQTEQEYLSLYLSKYFVIGENNNFNLDNLINKVKLLDNFKFQGKTKESLIKIDNIINNFL